MPATDPITDYTRLRAWAQQAGLALEPSTWKGRAMLLLTTGQAGVGATSDAVQVTFSFDDEGRFIDVLMTCTKCEDRRGA